MNLDIKRIRNIEVPKDIIEETQNFCKEKGRQGLESKIYWIGVGISKDKATVIKVFKPKQIARKSIFGVSVEVPEEGNLELIRILKANEAVLVKLHTHPKDAYLSDVDIANPFFRHEGAISIVIPNFCLRPLKLNNCCVNIFRNGNWVSLSTGEIDSLFSLKE